MFASFTKLKLIVLLSTCTQSKNTGLIDRERKEQLELWETLDAAEDWWVSMGSLIMQQGNHNDQILL